MQKRFFLIAGLVVVWLAVSPSGFAFAESSASEGSAPLQSVAEDSGRPESVTEDSAGQDSASQESSAEVPGSEIHHLRWFPPRLYAKGVFYLPKVTYSDRRGLGFGGDAIYAFRWPGSRAELPASELRLKGRITVKGQTQADLQAELHPVETFGLKLRVSHETLIERFYGIGPDTPSEAEEAYRPSHLNAYIELFRDVWSDLRLGARFELERVDLLEVDADGVLAQGDIRGSKGGENAIGTGLVLDWDKRDSKSFPTKGFYLQSFGLLLTMSSEATSTSTTTTSTPGLTCRRHRQRARAPVLHLRGEGRALFWHFAELGGRPHSRGFRRGRYRDRVLVAAQAEYRVRFLWRLGAAAFFGVADVAPAVDRMQLEHMKANFGGGPRFFIGDPGREITVRLDVGFGGDVPRYYFSLGEAF
ncbi:MAG: hypothetical protein R3E97_01270 [Candidatus Eisenbacteria bacterium]